MKTVITIGILTTLLAAAYYFGKRTLSAFNYELLGYGKPSLSGKTLTLPINIRFNNPTAVPVNIDRMQADVFVQKAGNWVEAARLDQPMSIGAGQSDQQFKAAIDLNSLFGGNLLATLSAIVSDIRSKVVTVRTDLTVTYGPVTIPTQTFIQDVALS